VSSRILIRYDTDDYTRWSWVALDKHNQPSGEVEAGDLQTLAAQAKGKRPVLILAGRSLLITRVDLPEGSRRVISRAIPYALEEQLAEEVDRLHFVQGGRALSGLIPVVVISKQKLAELLDLLSSVGIDPIWAVAEPLLLPWRMGELSILVRGQTATVRSGEIDGFECTLEQLPTLLGCLKSEAHDDYRIIRVWATDESQQVQPLLEDISDELTFTVTPNDFSSLTEIGVKRPLINLLQGYEESGDSPESSGHWWPAVALIFMAILTYLGTSGYQYQVQNDELKILNQSREALFRKTFPDVKRLVNLEVQAKRKLDERQQANGQGADALLSLLTVLGAAKEKIPVIILKNMEYRKSSLVIHLEGRSVAQIEQFKLQLESLGNAHSEIISTVSRGKQIEARIKLELSSS